MSTETAILITIILIAIYFLPTLVAQGKRNVGAVFVLNLFLGWTLIGWVIALVWGCTKDAVLIELPKTQAVRSEKKCPHCAEMIKKEAVICRFCRSQL